MVRVKAHNSQKSCSDNATTQPWPKRRLLSLSGKSFHAATGRLAPLNITDTFSFPFRLPQSRKQRRYRISLLPRKRDVVPHTKHGTTTMFEPSTDRPSRQLRLVWIRETREMTPATASPFFLSFFRRLRRGWARRRRRVGLRFTTTENALPRQAAKRILHRLPVRLQAQRSAKILPVELSSRINSGGSKGSARPLDKDNVPTRHRRIARQVRFHLSSDFCLLNFVE